MTLDETTTAALQALLADPLAGAHGKPATAGDRIEYRHWLYDADADDTTPAFVDLRKRLKPEPVR